MPNDTNSNTTVEWTIRITPRVQAGDIVWQQVGEKLLFDLFFATWGHTWSVTYSMLTAAYRRKGRVLGAPRATLAVRADAAIEAFKPQNFEAFRRRVGGAFDRCFWPAILSSLKRNLHGILNGNSLQLELRVKFASKTTWGGPIQLTDGDSASATFGEAIVTVEIPGPVSVKVDTCYDPAADPRGYTIPTL